MHSITIGPRIFMAAVALLAAVVTFADTRGAGAGSITVSERHEAEAEIARSLVVTRLENALGDAFGGVWFEPSTGQLHVGVPSAAGRRSAEAAADRAGAAEIVTETPVRSTWAELEAAQERWAHRLADLFGRAEAATSLRAQHNALEVELGASVPDARFAAARRAAAADDVNVLVERAPSEHLRIREQLQCNAFKADAAYCDPTIVAGVTIVHENEVNAPCTAGPAVIPKDASTGPKATERLNLTAGHCINTGKNKWFAYTKKGVKEEIGPGSSFLSGHVADIGAIKINSTSKWVQAGFIPVKPAIALWTGAESDPIPVVSDQEPVENAETCVSGQTSGTLCGEILATGVTLTNKSNMAEVNVVTQGGDSGAPWYSKSYAESKAGLVEGVHVGLRTSTGKAIFQPLHIGLTELKKASGLDVELLTQNNEERRHPVVKAKKYPATLSASNASSEDRFTGFGSTVSCSENEFDGELTETADFFEVTPVYKKCTTGALPVTVANNGCKYKLTPQEEVAEGQYSATVDVVCPGEQPGIQINVYSNGTHAVTVCTLTIPPQTGLETVTFTNDGEHIEVDQGAIEGVAMKLGGACGASETSSGVYDLGQAVTVEGSSEEEAVQIEIGAE